MNPLNKGLTKGQRKRRRLQVIEMLERQNSGARFAKADLTGSPARPVDGNARKLTRRMT